ncbi:hypothetical protein ACJW31_04G165400 [Castanea mollissima]
MDKLSFTQEGVTRILPPGFRFQPTDEELVFQYLKCKVFSCPLPASVIPEINVCKFDPWELLPGELEQERYFFSQKEAKYPNGNRIKRTTNSGYWKTTGTDKKIVSPRRNHIVGMKKTLVFYKGKPPHGSRTDWIMHEYRLVNAETTGCTFPQTHDSIQNSLVQMENWVLCRIYLKKGSVMKNNDMLISQTSSNNKIENVGVAQPRFFNFLLGYKSSLPLASSTSSSSSSSSSTTTEVSSSGADHEESTTARTTY